MVQVLSDMPMLFVFDTTLRAAAATLAKSAPFSAKAPAIL
jgi:hypothetical protein